MAYRLGECRVVLSLGGTDWINLFRVPEKRRRLDTVLAPAFVADLGSQTEESLLENHRVADTVENELSLFRVMLQAQIDLLEFEQRRRSGMETRTLMEALPELLSGQRSDHDRRYSDVLIDIEERSGRRSIDKVIDGDPLLVLDSLDDDQLADALEQLRHEEGSLSAARQLVHDVIDKLNQALAENRRLVEG